MSPCQKLKNTLQNKIFLGDTIMSPAVTPNVRFHHFTTKNRYVYSLHICFLLFNHKKVTTLLTSASPKIPPFPVSTRLSYTRNIPSILTLPTYAHLWLLGHSQSY